KEISYVTQKASLINTSIRENVAFGAEAEDEVIKNSLDMASSLDFVMQKENQLDEQIFESGKNLSGGQKQRLSIARALNKKSDLLILDDSFSASDYLTERKIKNSIKTLSNERNIAAILISQRINSIKDCDKILVLDYGKITGYGTHEELLNSCETYKEIYYSQERNN
ncbi:ABC transporter ATP-binding protein, partial [bacterium]|nr:ABC transporter ATP-binding protein [bacterium]